MIRIDNITVASGQFRLVDVSLHMQTGEYVVLMGASGIGKTTLLEAICGLRPTISGKILLHDRDVKSLPPGARNVGYVPQDGALFATMSVRENLAYSLRVRRAAADLVSSRVAEVAQLTGIAHLLDRSAKTLSGGEGRRVALGRALSFWPDILLLDEPLTGLDDETRGEMVVALRAVREAVGATILHVSHDERDAAGLADRVLHLDSNGLAERPLNLRDAKSLESAADTSR